MRRIASNHGQPDKERIMKCRSKDKRSRVRLDGIFPAITAHTGRS